MPECLAITALESVSINTGTNPDEVGLMFVLPGLARAGGALFCLSADSDVDLELIFYDMPTDDIHPIQVIPIKIRIDTFPAEAYTYYLAKFSQDVLLNTHSPYRIMVKPTTTTTVKLMTLRFHNQDISDGLYRYKDHVGNNYTFLKEWRTDGGAFVTNTSTQIVPLISAWLTG